MVNIKDRPSEVQLCRLRALVSKHWPVDTPLDLLEEHDDKTIKQATKKPFTKEEIDTVKAMQEAERKYKRLCIEAYEQGLYHIWGTPPAEIPFLDLTIVQNERTEISIDAHPWCRFHVAYKRDYDSTFNIDHQDLMSRLGEKYETENGPRLTDARLSPEEEAESDGELNFEKKLKVVSQQLKKRERWGQFGDGDTFSRFIEPFLRSIRAENPINAETGLDYLVYLTNPRNCAGKVWTFPNTAWSNREISLPFRWMPMVLPYYLQSDPQVCRKGLQQFRLPWAVPTQKQSPFNYKDGHTLWIFEKPIIEDPTQTTVDSLLRRGWPAVHNSSPGFSGDHIALNFFRHLIRPSYDLEAEVIFTDSVKEELDRITVNERPGIHYLGTVGHSHTFVAPSGKKLEGLEYRLLVPEGLPLGQETLKKIVGNEQGLLANLAFYKFEKPQDDLFYVVMPQVALETQPNSTDVSMASQFLLRSSSYFPVMKGGKVVGVVINHPNSHRLELRRGFTYQNSKEVVGKFYHDYSSKLPCNLGLDYKGFPQYIPGDNDEKEKLLLLYLHNSSNGYYSFSPLPVFVHGKWFPRRIDLESGGWISKFEENMFTDKDKQEVINTIGKGKPVYEKTLEIISRMRTVRL